MHRVVNTEMKEDDDELISIVFFTGPHLDTEVGMLSESPLVGVAGEGDKYPITTAGAHLMEKISASVNKY